MAIDFGKLTAKPLDGVKRPPAFPDGTFYGKITKYEWKESNFKDKNTGNAIGQVRYTIQVTSPGEDVPAEAIADIDLAKRLCFRDFSIEGDDLWIVKSVWDTFGIETAGQSVGACAPQLVGQDCKFEMTQRFDKRNPEVIYNDVKNIVPHS